MNNDQFNQLRDFIISRAFTEEGGQQMRSALTLLTEVWEQELFSRDGLLPKNVIKVPIS